MGRPDKYDHDFPSVTQIVGGLLPAEWKAYWFAKSVGVVALNLLVSGYQPFRKACAHKKKCDDANSCEVKKITQAAKADRDKVTRDSTDIGSGVHNAVEQFLKGKPFEECLEGLSQQQVSMFSRFTSKLSERKLVSVGIEQPYYSHKHKVAGTPDYVCREDSVLKVFDWKTSKKIDEKAYAYQMGGYALILSDAINEMPTVGEVWRVGKDLEIDEPYVVPDLAVWADKFRRMREVYADVYGK